MAKLDEYLKETKAELKHVSWPTRRQAIKVTLLIIVFSVAVALFLGALDLGFLAGLKFFTNK
jgi:preprotein translocase subunit SecE